MVVVIVTAGLVAVAWLWLKRPMSPVPAEMARQAQFDVFYPSRLPSGFAVDRATTRLQQGTLIFIAKNGSGDSIAFTEQAPPKDFDFNKFHDSLQGGRDLHVPPYRAVTGSAGNGLSVVSIETNRTWIMASSATSLSPADSKLIVSGLRPQ
jgi:hypothetical protein